MAGIIKIAVCDDDVAALNIVSGATESTFRSKGFEVEIQTFTKVSQVQEAMKANEFELLLLDIDLPGMDGIAFGHVLRKLNKHIEIIFVSNREDRVFESFAVHPFGFVRKSHFLKDITDVVDSYLIARPKKKTHMMVMQLRDKTLSVPISGVMYVEGNKKSQLVHIKNKTQPIEMFSSMEKLENDLYQHGFIRIHKGYLVNYLYIRLIGTVDVELINGEKILISRRKIQQTKARFLELVQGSGAIIF